MTTKKTDAKKTTSKKTVKKVEEPKVIKTEEVVEETENVIVPLEVTVQRIFYCLIIIAILLAVGVVGIFINPNIGGSSSSNNETTEEPQDYEYDASMFKQINADEFVSAFNSNETSVIYLGRPTCSYCAAFLPALQQAQKDFGYTTLYVNIEEIASSDVSKITDLDEWLNEYYGTTPLVVVVKDGKIQGEGWVGYAEYDSFAAYLEELGLKKSVK